MTDTIEVNITNTVTEAKKRGRPRLTNEITTSEEPKKVGRPITAMWRYGEDGKYNTQVIDPEYTKKYWREHYRKPFTCDICGTTLQCCGSGVHKHHRSMKCQLAKFKKSEPSSN
jgi:hypothetical protein